jgi:ABC-type transporter Mla subunit MlaD
VRNIADQLAALTTRANSETATLAEVRKTLVRAVAQFRFTGQGETEISRILHERRDDLDRLLSPLAPLVSGARTPLGQAVRNLLAALGKTAEGGG